MNSIVLYFYPKPRRSITLDESELWLGGDLVGYVRTELHLNRDAVHALDAAKPNENETVLNAVELP